MMNFDLTDEQRLLEQTVREWGAREIAPRIKELDRAHRFDKDILPQMAELGLLGISVPVEYGGAGMDYISLGLASEELEYVDTSLRVIMSVHAGLNCLSLLTWGTEEQKQRYLVPQAQGKKIATYGLTEPAAGSDVRGIQTVAVEEGRPVSSVGREDVDLAGRCRRQLPRLCVVGPGKEEAARHLRHLRVHRRARIQGIFERDAEGEVGHPRGQHRLLQDGRDGGARGKRARAGGEGFKIAMFALDQGRYTVAAGATGLIRACRDAASKYALQRKTFGELIANHQLVKQMIANMESDYQISRLLWLQSGFLKNEGRRNTRETSLAKWFSTVASERAAGDAVQVHGANGYSDEYPSAGSTATARAR